MTTPITTNPIHQMNPWNGLRTYTEGEILYGRSEEIHVLSLLILQSHQTIVYGRSGIGKSSILNAGIFPIVRQQGVFPVYVRFEHNTSKSYLEQIKDAIKREVEASEGKIQIKKLVDKTCEESLWEFFHRIEYRTPEGELVKPLVVFDQFEEIFTLEGNKEKTSRFFRELADLINNVMPVEISSQSELTRQTDAGSSKNDGMLDLGLDIFSEISYSYKTTSDFHLVFTLREDFLSYLERNTTDIPALKNNRYCLQPINDEQAAEIIMSPRPGLVDKQVAKLIIEKVTGEHNFEIDGVPEIQVDSAILSLYLSRLYDKMVAEGATTITAALVEAHSANIIENFYDDAIRGLDSKSVEWLEDTLINEDGRRDNRDRSTVMRESSLTENELDRLINEVKLLRQFSYGGDLRIEYIHDVLCPVILERRKQRLENQKIKQIELKAKAEKKKALRKLISIIGGFVIVLLTLAAVTYKNFYDKEKLFKKYYAEFQLVNGWPEGVGEPLKANELSSYPLYYMLTKEGHDTPHYTEVTVCSSNTMLPAGSRLEWPELCSDPNDVEGGKINGILGATASIRFVAGDDGKISRMELYNEAGEQLFIFCYFHTSESSAWINYLTTSGQTAFIRDNQIDRCKIDWDSLGRISEMKFFNSSGDLLQIQSKDDISSYMLQYPDEHSSRRYLLNDLGLPTTRSDYNLIATYRNADTIRTEYFSVKSLDDPKPMSVLGDAGYSKVEEIGNLTYLYLPGIDKPVAQSSVKTDRHGNIVEQKVDGDPSKIVAPLTKMRYKGDTGLATEMRKLKADGTTPFGTATDIYLWVWDYDEAGQKVSEDRITASGDTVYSFRLTTETTPDGMKVTRKTIKDLTLNEFLTKVDTIGEGFHSIAYYNIQGQPVNRRMVLGPDSLDCHWMREYTEGATKITECYIVESDIVRPAPTIIDGATCRATSFRTKATRQGDTEVRELLDGENQIVRRMIYFERNGQVVARAACSIIDNKPIRCPKWEEDELGYYMVYFSKNFFNDFTAIKAYDEWSNPSILSVDGNAVEIDYKDYKGQQLADGYLIQKSYFQRFMQADKNASGLKVPYVHILSKGSVLYKDPSNRLLDGDRLVAFGNWRLGQPESLLAKEWKKLESEGNSVAATVMRPAADRYQRLAVTLSGAKGEANRSEYHIFNMSKQEAAKFNSDLATK